MRIFCSICKDTFIPYAEVHVTNCGHLYHGSCIGTWIKQHKTCPQCRASLSQPFRVYFDVEKDSETDSSTLLYRLEAVSDKLREKERSEKQLLDEKKNFEKIVKDMKKSSDSLNKKNAVLRASLDVLKEEVIRLTRRKESFEQLESSLEKCKTKIMTLERIESLITSSADDVNKMVESTPVSEQAVKHLCTYVGVLKAQLQKTEARNTSLFKKVEEVSRELAKEKDKPSTESDKIIKNLKAEITKLKNDRDSLHTLANYYKTKYVRKCKQFAPPHSSTAKIMASKNFEEINLDALEEELSSTVKKQEVPSSSSAPESEKRPSPPASPETEETIRHWQELLSAGPISNLGLRLKCSRTLNALANKSDADTSRSSAHYAFDGYGGSKRIRLGGPTPIEEFRQIKKGKTDKKRGEQIFSRKKINDYFNIEI